jgi:hypothetical protein
VVDLTESFSIGMAGISNSATSDPMNIHYFKNFSYIGYIVIIISNFGRLTDQNVFEYKNQITEIPMVNKFSKMFHRFLRGCMIQKIIGLSMQNELTQELTIAALRQAVDRRRPDEGLIHHSDRGSQYATYAYQGLLKQYNIIQYEQKGAFLR